MNHTADLIKTLSLDAASAKPVRAPTYWAARLFGVLIAYGVISQMVIGIRPNVMAQFNDPAFVLELGLLALLVASAALACVIAIYPDHYQKPVLLRLPYFIGLLFVGLVVTQVAMESPTPNLDFKGMECAICVASLSLLPSAILYGLVRKGATTAPSRAGFCAVLSASAMGCLTLRLAEAPDSYLHLALWHYLPTMLFAMFGALLSRWFLKW